jgi:hypothetical protein
MATKPSSPCVPCRTDKQRRARQGALVTESLPKSQPSPETRARSRHLALSRWESEGGTHPDEAADAAAGESAAPADAEADQLRMRVIALENLVIALLAEASSAQRCLAADMADFISPRPGYTPHPLTLRAAQAMRSMLDRAAQFGSNDTE